MLKQVSEVRLHFVEAKHRRPYVKQLGGEYIHIWKVDVRLAIRQDSMKHRT